MKSSGTYRFWRSAEQCLLGSIAVALLTFICFRLQVGLTIASLLYLTVVVLLSVMDAFVASVLVSIIAVLCLDYFFAKPLFSLQMDDPLNIVAVIAFLGTALLISRLMSQRKRAEAALQKLLGELESKVQERTAELARANDDLRSEMGERQRAEEALQTARSELAHVSRVNNDTFNDQKHHFFPWAAAKPNGNVYVGWYDDRNDRFNAKVDYFVGKSVDGGKTFPKQQAVSDVNFNPCVGFPGSCAAGSFSHGAVVTRSRASRGEGSLQGFATPGELRARFRSGGFQRRQAIDLRTDHAVEKLGGAPRLYSCKFAQVIKLFLSE